MVGGNKVVATLRADGRVYPEGFISNLNLMNYKIRTEAEMANKLNTLSVATTVVDLGKQLLQFARDSDLKGVRNMLSRGAPFTSDWLGMSALHFAAMNNQFEICEALLRGGINKDSKTKVDRTPLHLACYYGNDRIVELLLAKKCAINPRDMLRMSPLHWAVEKRHKQIVRMLLEHNADVTVVSKFGRTPIALAVMTEQADLLDELKAAKQMQVNRKLNDEQEKETSDAVNSIIGLKNEVLEDSNGRQKMDVDGDDEYINPQEYAEVKISDFANIKETGLLDNTAINLLKSHGISMMQDDEEDTSKELLSTVLRNGRQLVLTEGGKLLLNEAKRTQNDFIKHTLTTSNNNNNYNNNNNNNNNSNNTATSPNSKYGQVVAPLRNQITPINKIRTSVISKPKDTNAALGKNKNIRIISLNDFKKLYGNTNLKAIHKLPSSLANERTVRKLSDDGKSVERKMMVNVGQISGSNRQLKVPLTESLQDSNHINEKENPIMDIIEIEPTDSEAELNDTEQRVPSSSLPSAATITTIGGSTGGQSLRVMSGRRILDHQSTINPISVRPYVPAMTKQMSSSATSKASGDTTLSSNSKQSTTTTTAATATTTPSVIPLLSVPEICRQLYEFRKQNEELRRKFDFVQKEKEEMRQRLERLEELLLVEKTDDDYPES